MRWLFCVLAACLISGSSSRVLKVALLDVDNFEYSKQIQAAIRLAVLDLNMKFRNEDLSDVLIQELVRTIPDSEDNTPNLLRTGQQISADPEVVSLIGSWDDAISLDSQVLVKGTERLYLGYKSESPILGDSIRFPQFLRVNPSSYLKCLAMVRLIHELEWLRVGVLSGYTREEEGDMFLDVARASTLSVVQRARLEIANNKTAAERALDNLIDSGATVLVLAVSRQEFVHIMDAARARGITGAGPDDYYVFLLLEDITEWNLSALNPVQRQSMRGVMGVKWHATDFNAFSARLNAEMQRADPRSPSICEEGVCEASIHAGFAADAVKVLGHSLQTLLKTKGSDAVITSEELMQASLAQAAAMDGYTGIIEFHTSGERWMGIDIVNVQLNARTQKMSLRVVGQWTPPDIDGVGDLQQAMDMNTCARGLDGFDLGRAELARAEIMWPDGTNKRPSGASTFVDIGVIKPGPNILRHKDAESYRGYFNDWFLAIGEAIAEINLSPNILEHTTLRMAVSEYNEKEDLLPQAGQLVLHNPLIAAVLGPEYNSKRFDDVAPIMTEHMTPHVDYSTSGSLLLKDETRQEYPYYVSTVPSDALAARAVAELLRFYSWRHVIFIYSSTQSVRRTIFDEATQDQNVVIMARAPVSLDESIQETRTKMVDLKRTGARTVICWMDEPELFRRTYRAATEIGLTGGNVTWIVPNFDVAESIRFNNMDWEPPYSPRLLLSMQGLIALYPQITGEDYTGDPARVHEQSEADYMFKTTSNSASPYASVRTIFARDAVYLISMALEALVKENKDPLDGKQLVKTMRDSTYTYDVAASGSERTRGGWGTGTERTYIHRNEIAVNEGGSRLMTLEVKNVNWDGEFKTIGLWDPSGGGLLFDDGNNTIFADGTTNPPTDRLCDFNYFYDVSAQTCTACDDNTFGFDEAQWKCGDRRPPVQEFETMTSVIVIWIGGIIVAGVFMAFFYWRYNIFVSRKDTISDWRAKAAANLRRGLRLDVLVSGFMVLAEAVDLVTNWMLGFVFIQVKSVAFLHIVLSYFIILAVSTILSLMYMYCLSITLGETFVDLRRGVTTIDDLKLAALTERRMMGDRRGSYFPESHMPSLSRVKDMLIVAKLTLVLAFVEDATTVAFCMVYLLQNNWDANMVVIVSLLVSVLNFGQKLGAWKDLMFLTEKSAWISTLAYTKELRNTPAKNRNEIDDNIALQKADMEAARMARMAILESEEEDEARRSPLKKKKTPSSKRNKKGPASSSKKKRRSRKKDAADSSGVDSPAELGSARKKKKKKKSFDKDGNEVPPSTEKKKKKKKRAAPPPPAGEMEMGHLQNDLSPYHADASAQEHKQHKEPVYPDSPPTLNDPMLPDDLVADDFDSQLSDSENDNILIEQMHPVGYD